MFDLEAKPALQQKVTIPDNALASESALADVYVPNIFTESITTTCPFMHSNKICAML